MADFDLSLGSIDDATYLRLRNVQLETELRYVKEQLAQAHSGTQYLVGCFANAHASRPIASANSNGYLLQRMQEENEYLRRQLGITLDSSNETHLGQGVESPQTRPRALQHSLSHHASDVDPPKDSLVQPAHANDLLTFEVDEVSPTTTNLQSPVESFSTYVNARPSFTHSPFDKSFTSYSSVPAEYARTAKSSNKDAVGLGISKAEARHGKLYDSPRGIDEEPEYVHSHGICRPKESNYYAKPPYETHEKVASAPTGLWSSIHAAPPPEPELVFDRPFLDAEHNRLLNAACFIEDMTGEERKMHWIRMGREKGRHSAKEWKLYYEKVVRPAFIAKSKKAGDTATAIRPTGTCALTDQDIHVEKLAEGPGDVDSYEIGTAATAVETPAVDDTADNTLLQLPHDLGRSASALSTPDQDAPEAVQSHLLADDFTKSHQRKLSSNTKDQDLDSAPKRQLGNAPTPSKLGISDFETMASTSPHRNLKAIVYTPMTDTCPAIDTPPTDPQDSTLLRPRPRFSPFPTQTSQISYSFGNKVPSPFRTMLVSNMAAGVTLARVVSAIRGGRIVKATFLETKGMKTMPPMTTNAVTIEFLDASAASAALDHWTEEHAALQGCQSGVQPLTASILRTPTRPLPAKLGFDMRERGLTRVFYIVDEMQKWTPEKVMGEIMQSDIRQRRPLVAGRRENDVLFFEFADVRHAAMAWDVVDRDQWALRGLKKGFLPDPCSEMGSEGKDDAEGAGGSNVENESDGGSTMMNTPMASFEVNTCDD
jgi:hypothetical protein